MYFFECVLKIFNTSSEYEIFSQIEKAIPFSQFFGCCTQISLGFLNPDWMMHCKTNKLLQKIFEFGRILKVLFANSYSYEQDTLFNHYRVWLVLHRLFKPERSSSLLEWFNFSAIFINESSMTISSICKTSSERPMVLRCPWITYVIRWQGLQANNTWWTWECT